MKIIVVGAGIVGCAVAHELASRGADVHLFDARGVGQGATRASAGMLAPALDHHLPELRRLASRSLSMYDEFIRRVERDAGGRIEYARSGTLNVALGESEAAALDADAARLDETGVEHTLLDREQVRRLEPSLSPRATSGLYVPTHGYVRATELTEALARAAQARGARLSILPVQRVEDRARGVAVITAGEAFEADAVVLASGSWPVESWPEAAPPVRPIRGQLVHLRAEHPIVSRVIWGSECYLVPWRDGSVLVGATVEDVGYDERPTAGGVRMLLDAAITLVPALGGARFDGVRVGLRPRGPDELPVIGRSAAASRVFYALGHYRNGIVLAPLTAAIVADLVLEGRERPELDAVRPDRVAAG